MLCIDMLASPGSMIDRLNTALGRIGPIAGQPMGSSGQQKGASE